MATATVVVVGVASSILEYSNAQIQVTPRLTAIVIIIACLPSDNVCDNNLPQEENKATR